MLPLEGTGPLGPLLPEHIVEFVIGLVLFGIIFASTMYFEVALLFAMVGFVTTVAFCKFLLRGNVIE